MADTSQQIADGFKRAVDAQIRYYRALGDVTTEYMKTLIGIWTDAKLPILPIDLGAFRPPPRSPASSTPTPAAPPAAAPVPALVLEAELGQQAQGVFMVENKLLRQVSAPVVTSAFIGPNGRETRPILRVEPGIVSLEPGTRTLVHLIASINEELVAGAAYNGEISVPGLSDMRVPVVLRRRESAQPAPTTDAGASAGAGQSQQGTSSDARSQRPTVDNGITN